MSSKKAEKGWHMTPNKFSRAGKEVSCVAYRVYGVIASFKPSYPSFSALEKYSGVSRKSISKALKELSGLNVISILSRGTFRGNTNEYQINPPDQWLLPSGVEKLGAIGNQSSEETSPSVEIPPDLGDEGNQEASDPWFPGETDPSFPSTPTLVSPGHYNNNNIKRPIKKTNTSNGVSLNGGSAHAPTPTHHEVDSPGSNAFDFEALYVLFPKRGKDMKKSLGMQKCRTQIKTQEQYDNLKSAVLHYDEHIKSEKRKRFDYDISFIKTWGHFMSKTYWVDWIRPNGHAVDKEIIVCGKEETCKPSEESIL